MACTDEKTFTEMMRRSLGLRGGILGGKDGIFYPLIVVRGIVWVVSLAFPNRGDFKGKRG
jgi:hypothetical protein